MKAQIEIEVEADDEFDIEGALEMEVPTATIVSLTDLPSRGRRQHEQR